MEVINHEFLNECAKITEDYDKLMGGWSVDSQLLHIIKEVTEFANVLRNKKDKFGKTLSPEWYNEFYDELADIHLTIFSTDNFLNNLEYEGKKIDVSPRKLNQAIRKKLDIVKQRVIEIKAQQNSSKVSSDD